jgi:hypothetical protein
MVGKKPQIMVDIRQEKLRSEKFKSLLNYAASTGKYLPNSEEWYSKFGVKISERFNIQIDFFFIKRYNT